MERGETAPVSLEHDVEYDNLLRVHYNHSSQPNGVAASFVNSETYAIHTQLFHYLTEALSYLVGHDKLCHISDVIVEGMNGGCPLLSP